MQKYLIIETFPFKPVGENKFPVTPEPDQIPPKSPVISVFKFIFR